MNEILKETAAVLLGLSGLVAIVCALRGMWVLGSGWSWWCPACRLSFLLLGSKRWTIGRCNPHNGSNWEFVEITDYLTEEGAFRRAHDLNARDPNWAYQVKP
jgi:hypothetical protein